MRPAAPSSMNRPSKHATSRVRIAGPLRRPSMMSVFSPFWPIQYNSMKRKVFVKEWQMILRLCVARRHCLTQVSATLEKAMTARQIVAIGTSATAGNREAFLESLINVRAKRSFSAWMARQTIVMGFLVCASIIGPALFVGSTSTARPIFASLLARRAR